MKAEPVRRPPDLRRFDDSNTCLLVDGMEAVCGASENLRNGICSSDASNFLEICIGLDWILIRMGVGWIAFVLFYLP